MGSLEAISMALTKIPMGKIRLRIIFKNIGPPSEKDIGLAEHFKGPIFCFNIQPDKRIEGMARDRDIFIYSFSVIYHLVERVQNCMLNLLPASFDSEILGRARILKKLAIDYRDPSGTKVKGKAVAGSTVLEGCLKVFGKANSSKPKSLHLKISRNGEIIHQGDQLESLRHFKEDVQEVAEGMECGIMLASNFSDFQPGDIIELTSHGAREKSVADLE